MRLSFTNKSTRYLGLMGFTIFLCLSAAFLFNAIVDPLWYYGGNQIKPVNFAFNERLSKVNLIAGHEKDYDCIIFGDSRVTLLPEQKIEGYRCFNFAFSAGVVDEHLAYAKWLKAHGLDPKLVIIGVSASNFRDRPPGRNVPQFIRDMEEPDPAFIKYLSLDVIEMSWRTLFGSSPIDRVYDRDFHCRVAITSQYDPRVPIRDFEVGPFNSRRQIEQYQALRDVFPDARFVGFAPPVSAWAIAGYEKIGWLPSFTRALSDAAQVFDRFVDTSVPSPITIDPANTYDGTHYSSKVNAEIAARLISGDMAPSLNLKEISHDEMLTIYRERLSTYSGVIADHAGVPPGGQDQAAYSLSQ